MSDEKRCIHCGAPLAPDAPQGLCPVCLLERGLDSETGSYLGGGQSHVESAPTPAEIAPLFPDLEILEVLGQGGMGVVYKARQRKLNRLVALKILGVKSGSSATFADRFAREARAMAMLNHPHIVTVYDFGQASGLFYFLMEFVDGANLRQVLAHGNLGSQEALAIIPQICDALQYAHEKGIVHRDIKPANILLDRDGRIKIADFGVAKLMGQKPEDGLLTGEGHVMGTPHYMAPEQVEHPLEVDHRADIYSLGVVLYQMLTGELPLGRFAPPSKKVQIDVRLDEIVLRALEKTPELRFQTASELRTQVETIVHQKPPSPNMPAAMPLGDSWEYKSRAELFGIPLVHVTSGLDPATGRLRVARGIFAFGGIAHGFVACGGRAKGVIAVGGLATGIFALGGVAIGLFAFGGVALGLLVAFGGLVIGALAMGGGAIGILASGGLAIGMYAHGGLAVGHYAAGGQIVANHAIVPPEPMPAILALLARALPWSQSILAMMLVPFILLLTGVPYLVRHQLVDKDRLAANAPYKTRRDGHGLVALCFASLSGLLGLVALASQANPIHLLVWSIPVFAILGIVFAIPARGTLFAKAALGIASVNLAFWIAIVVATWQPTDSWQAKQLLATLDEKTQTLEEQMQIVEGAVALDPSNLDARRLWAQKFMERKEYSKAAGAWDHLVRNDQSNYGSLAIGTQGIAHLMAGELPQAAARLAEAVRRDPTNLSARVFLATTYAELGLNPQADSELLLLAKINPDWQDKFLSEPDLSSERRIAIDTLKPFLQTQSAQGPQQIAGTDQDPSRLQSVDLVAVERLTPDGIQRWQPDGSPLSDTVRQALAAYSANPTHPVVYTFVVKYLGQDLLDSWHGQFGGSSPQLNMQAKSEQLGGNIFRIEVTDPKTAKIDVRFSLPYGPLRKLLIWKLPDLSIVTRNPPFESTAPTLQLKSVIGSKSNLIQQPLELMTQGTLKFPEGMRYKWDWKLQAVDENGRHHDSSPDPGVNTSTGGLEPFDPNEFVGAISIAREDIRQLTLLGRSHEQDYFNAEFKDVALEPKPVANTTITPLLTLFEPTIARSLDVPPRNSMPSSWLDLDHDKPINFSEYTGDKDDSGELANWLRQHDADLCAFRLPIPTMDDGNTTKPPAFEDQNAFAPRGLGTLPECGLLAMPVDAALWDTVQPQAIFALRASLDSQTESSAARKLIPDEQSPTNPTGRLPSTFAFKTAAGRMGLLRIDAISTQPERIVFRYKLVRAMSFDSLSLTPVTPEQVRFEPIVERSVPFGAPCCAKYFQFRTGDIFEVGEGPGDNSNHADVWEKIEASGGVDAMSIGGKDAIQFCGEGCVFVARSAPDLQNISADEVLKELRRTTFITGMIEANRSSFPLTYLFKTATGDAGILQIYDIANNSRGYESLGMKMRYKLVHNPRSVALSGRQVLAAELEQLRARWTQQLAAFQSGLISQLELKTTQRDLKVLEAKLNGDAEAVATAELTAARNLLDITKRLFEAGRISATDYQKAQQDVVVAETKLRVVSSQTQASPAKSTKFGPVIELTMKSPAVDRAESYLDLESGKCISLPKEIASDDFKAVAAWASANGVDAVADTSEKTRGLLGFKLHIVSAPDSEWDAATLESIQKNVVGKEFQFFKFGGQWPQGDHDTESWVASANTISTAPRSTTFEFRTRENHWGVLQLLAVQDEPGGFVKLRYKLHDSEPSQAAPAASEPKFSPVVERVVNLFPDTRENCALKLETAHLVTLPESIHPAMRQNRVADSPEEKAMLSWARENHVDLIGFAHAGDVKHSKRGALGPNLVAVSVENDAWQKLAASDAVEKLRERLRQWSIIPEFAELLVDEQSTATFVVQTRESRIGILQIETPRDNVRTIIVRYKLVELATKSESQDAVKPRADDKASPEANR